MAQVLLPGEAGAEGHAAGHHAGIGAAADGEGVALLAGDLAVGGQQALHLAAVGVHVVGGGVVEQAHGHAAVLEGHHRGGGDPAHVRGLGHAHVQCGGEHAVLVAQAAEVAGEPAGEFVLARRAQALAEAFQPQLVRQGGDGGPEFPAYAQELEHLHEHTRGVFAQLGHAGVGALADYGELHGLARVLQLYVVARFYLNFVDVFGKGGLVFHFEHRLGDAGHHVHAVARIDADQFLSVARCQELKVHVALLKIDDRELRVGGEAVVGHLLVGGVVP